MTKAKYIIAVLFASLILLIIPNISKAAVTVTREIETRTSMKYSLSGLTLNEEHNYEYGFSTKKSEEVKSWYSLTNYSATKADVRFNFNESSMRNVFYATDTGYISIRDVTDAKKIVVDSIAVDLKIPYLQVTNYTVINNGKSFSGANIITSGWVNHYASFQYEKITDTNIINKYKEIKEKNGDVLEMEGILSQTVPSSRLERF